jgi:hypothetical protein
MTPKVRCFSSSFYLLNRKLFEIYYVDRSLCGAYGKFDVGGQSSVQEKGPSHERSSQKVLAQSLSDEA